ncbi:NAD binding domain of 6-phosphogluconate dehydrogenase-domain-containing protein [Xylariales sp. PMI_506]|nr:NAD binding domain of 6-phosphogluconate dehydrogenase-domain-containing protein [Xylariales sp. PMI_506]
MSAKPEIAFIGLGAMGFGMATNLVKRGYAVVGFDVWGPTLEKFRAAGGSTASSPAETVASRNFCVCMVATAQQAQQVLIDGDGAAVPALPHGATLLLCSTVPASYVEDLQQQLVQLGRGDIHFVDAPVSGGTQRAADGVLSIMAGGSDVAIQKSWALLGEMADPEKLYIGKGGVGAGSNLKMVHQVLAAVQILAASEAMGFASLLGLDLPKTAETILTSQGRSWMFENRVPRMLHPDFKPIASALTIILKDTSIITGEARRRGFPTLMSSTAEQVYFSGLAKGYGPDDDSSLIRVYTEGKGKIGPVVGTAESEDAKLTLVIALLKGIHLCSAAEMIALSARLGLDLDQVFNLCLNAAGGSSMLESIGPDMMSLAKGSTPTGSDTLESVAKGLQDAIDEAQRLKMPLHLGHQAFNIMELAVAHRPKSAPPAKASEVIRVWGF